LGVGLYFKIHYRFCLLDFNKQQTEHAHDFKQTITSECPTQNKIAILEIIEHSAKVEWRCINTYWNLKIIYTLD